GDLLFAEATLEYGEPLTAGVQGQVDGEVANEDLFASRVERPLIGQEDGAVGADAGQGRARGRRGWGGRLVGGPAESGEQAGGGGQQGGGSKGSTHGVPHRRTGA